MKRLLLPILAWLALCCAPAFAQTNQGQVQASVRALTGTTYDYNGDFEALFDGAGIPAYDFNGRMLSWINKTLGTSYGEINGAKAAYAAALGFPSWNALQTVDPYPGANVALDFAGPVKAGLPFYKLNGVIYQSFGAIPGASVSRASNETCQWADGHLSYAGSNVLCTTDLGVGIWQGATNLALQSVALGNATWGRNNATVGATTTAPDGTATAVHIAEGATNTTHSLYQTLTLTSGTVYTQSFYLKAAERTWAYVTEGNNVSATVFVNLSTCTKGTVSGTGSPSATVTAASNGWCRVTLTFTPISNAGNVQAGTASGNGTNTYAGDGSSGIYAWGGQMETGGFATPLIPDTTTTATRAADVLKIAGAGAYIRAPSTTLVSFNGLPSFGGPPVMFSTTGDTVTLLLNGGATGSLYGATATPNSLVTSNATTFSTAGKVGARFDGSTRAVVLNGGTVASDGNASVAGTDLWIGSDTGSAQWANTYIKRLLVKSTAETNAQFQADTQ